MKKLTILVAAAAVLVAGYQTSKAGSCGSSHASSKSASYDHSHDKAHASATMTDIVDLAIGAGSFKTLTSALVAADLVDVLRGDGPFTVFAPTDEAFAKLPKGTLEALLKPENRDQLTAILTYHVVPGKLDAEEVASRRNIKTVNGQRIDIQEKRGGLLLDDSKVVSADLFADNGVVHVVDTVLLPN